MLCPPGDQMLKRNRRFASVFIAIWFLSTIGASWLPIPSQLLVWLPGDHARALYWITVLVLFSIAMYVSDVWLELDGLLHILPSRSRLSETLEWSSFFSSKITTLSIFAGAMGTMLTLVVTFLTTGSQAIPNGIPTISGIALVSGLMSVFVALEAYDTLSGRRWEQQEREKLAARALNYYILSWYCLVIAVLLLAALLSVWITLIGCLVYTLVVGRYYFFMNLKRTI